MFKSRSLNFLPKENKQIKPLKCLYFHYLFSVIKKKKDGGSYNAEHNLVGHEKIGKVSDFMVGKLQTVLNYCRSSRIQ